MPNTLIFPSRRQVHRVQSAILAWFDQQGRKDLPWQQEKTPYRIWVSEIMLQQTQVNTVIPYFHRFMARFPRLEDLAKAAEDEVLYLWAGLGYYSRARNLHQSAKLIWEAYQDDFPRTLETLCALPGIGLSTAGAILAIALNQPATILDGNVKRVLARFHCIEEPINKREGEKQLWELASNYTPTERIAAYSQAMMDLGALICTPRKPQCTQCPLKISCRAYRENKVDLLPRKSSKRQLPVREATFLIVQKKDKTVFLQKRPSSGIWGGLWSLPELEGLPRKKMIRDFCLKHYNWQVTELQELTVLRHTFSHYHLDISPVKVTIKSISAKSIEEPEKIWYNTSDPRSIGLPKPILTLLREYT